MNPGTREGSPPSAVLGGMPDDNAHANSLFAHLGIRRAGEKFSLVYDYGDTHHIVMEVVKVENVDLGEQLCEVLIIEPEAQSEPALPEGQVTLPPSHSPNLPHLNPLLPSTLPSPLTCDYCIHSPVLLLTPCAAVL
jgi:hypothetical protein